MREIIGLAILLIVSSFIIQSVKPERYKCPECGTEKIPISKSSTEKTYDQEGGEYAGEATSYWRECPECEIKINR